LTSYIKLSSLLIYFIIISLAVQIIATNVMGVSSNITNAFIAISIFISFLYRLYIKKFSYFLVIIIFTNSIIVVFTQNFGSISPSILLMLFYILDLFYSYKLLKKLYINIFFIFITTIIFYFFGLNNQYNIIFYRQYQDQLIYRSSIGFLNPNRAMMLWLVLEICILSLFREKTRKICIILFIITIILYTFTKTLSVTLLSLFALIFIFIFSNKINYKICDLYKKIIIILPLVYTIFSLVLSLCYDIEIINNILS